LLLFCKKRRVPLFFFEKKNQKTFILIQRLTGTHMDRFWVALGALAGLLAVGAAALASHAPGWGGQAMRDAVQILGWHALALVAAGIWARRGGWLAHGAAAAFLAGTVMFVGAVFALNLRGIRLGALAPAGGITLMVGWALLALSALRAR
jgi:uncharacterized membrane protein YgdD (TMEM256/DUF423 family)